MDSKTLSLLLFGSLAANLFLGGIVSARMFGGEASPAAAESAEVESPQAKDPPPPHPKKPKGFAKRKQLQKDRDGARKRKGREHGPSQGSRDLMLLRHMVKIMGGPDDPRIKEVHEAKKEDIKATRREMKEAHDRVYEALTAEEPDNAELSASLQALRKKTFEAQAQAQKGIVQLAELMKPEERAKLRKIKLGGPPERKMRLHKKGGAHPGGHQGPPPRP